MKGGVKEKLAVEFKKLLKENYFSIDDIEFESEFESFKKTVKLGLPYFFDITHFSTIIDFPTKQISYLINNQDKAYATFYISKKSGGKRVINAPCRKLKYIQRWILDNILYKLDTGEYAFGFIPEKSIGDNAKIHENQELICGIDIKDFFPSIHGKRVYGFFKSCGYNNKMAYNFAKLSTYQDKLPQGAPTSPMISNLICWKMDKRIGNFCHKRRLKYTRYADDITISGNHDLPRYSKLIFKIIRDEGFELNEDKFRIIGRGHSQKVTGIVVNDFVSIGRKRKRRLRAIVHNISKNGPIEENRDNDPFFKNKLFGELSFAKMINPNFAKPLIKKLNKINWKPYDKFYSFFAKEQIDKRDIKRNIKNYLIEFDRLGFFKEIPLLPKLNDSEFDKLKDGLKELSEKCKEHGKDSCLDCLLKEKKSDYLKCLKYILGQYVRNTGGHHHGHEIYDMAGDTELYKGSRIERMVFIIFLLKSYGMTTDKKNSLFYQFYKAAQHEEPDILSIVAPDDLDHELKLHVRNVAKKATKEKDICLILRPDMLRIYRDFINNIND